MTSKTTNEVKGWIESVAKFPMGRTVATRAVAARMAEDLMFAQFATKCLVRHASGHWGNLGDEDKAANEKALSESLRLFSSYWFRGDETDKLWIITEHDRSYTTLLFPSDY